MQLSPKTYLALQEVNPLYTEDFVDRFLKWCNEEKLPQDTRIDPETFTPFVVFEKQKINIELFQDVMARGY